MHKFIQFKKIIIVFQAIQLIDKRFVFDKSAKIGNNEVNPLLRDLDKLTPIVDTRQNKLKKNYLIENLDKQIEYEKNTIIRVPSIVRQKIDNTKRKAYVSKLN